MTYVAAALDFLLGCHHSNLSRVFTISGRTYRVCCDCGAQFNTHLKPCRSDSRTRRPGYSATSCI